MTKPLSLIIPVRAMARLAAGETVREAAAALSVAPSSLVKWSQRRRATRNATPGKIDGHVPRKSRGEQAGSFACKSRRLPISCRRRQRSRLERATSGVRNSRTTAGRSSINTSSVLRRTTATASCAAVKVVCNRCGLWPRSCTLSRCFHLYMVCPFVGKTIHWIVF